MIDKLTLDHFNSAIQTIAVIFIGIQLLFIFLETRKKYNFEKNLNTLNILSSYYDNFMEAYQLLRTKKSSKALKNLDEMDAEMERKIREYLRLCERIAVGVKHGVYSAEIISDLQSKSLRRNFVKLKPFINLVRTKSGNTNRVWDVFEWLCYELERRAPEKIIPKDWTCVEQRPIGKE